MRLDKPLSAVVATLAEALERTKPEFVDVAVMRLDVIADCRRLDDAALKAEFAQRVFEQLVPPNPRPAPGAVPCVPLRRLAANTHNIQPSSSALGGLQSTQRRYSIARPSLTRQGYAITATISATATHAAAACGQPASRNSSAASKTPRKSSIISASVPAPFSSDEGYVLESNRNLLHLIQREFTSPGIIELRRRMDHRPMSRAAPSAIALSRRL